MDTRTAREQSITDMLTTHQAADMLGLKTQTLHDWRCRGVGPRYHRLGRAVRYQRGDVLAFLDARAVEPGVDE